MRILTHVFISSLILLSCSHEQTKNCYPKQLVAKTVILVADTIIFGRYFVPENDTIRTYPVFDGIGFVRLNGIPVHKPMMTLVLSGQQQKEFLKILRPISPLDKGTTTACIPYYRHVILFFDKTNKLIGQIHICFGCKQVRFLPEPGCLNYFDNVRIKELRNFFTKNNIPLIDE